MASTAEQSVDLLFKSSNLVLSTIDTTMNLVNKMLDYLQESKDPMIKAMRNYVKAGGKLEFVVCQPEYGKAYEETLKDAGVHFMQSVNTACGSVCVFIFPEKERMLVNDVLREFRAEYGKNGMVDHQVMQAYSQGRVREINHLTRNEASVFVERAEQSGIKVVISEPGKDRFKVTYAETDINIMNHIKADMAVEFSGEAGKALNKQLDYENENVVAHLDLIKNYEESEMLYLIDLKGNELQIDRDGVAFYDENGVFDIEKLDPKFNEKVNVLVMNMKNGVLLNEEQRRAYEQCQDKKKFLVDLDHKNGRPQLTEREFQALRELSLKKELYEMKLAMVEPEQGVYDICLECDDMRLATFEELDDINEMKMNQELEPELLDEMKERFRQYKIHDNSAVLDCDLVNFQEAVLDGREKDIEQEMNQMELDYSDLLHDKNNNYMHDEFEVGFTED